MSKFKNQNLQSSVRKPVSSASLVLQILELQHAVLLRYEDAVHDGDISELNNAVRSLLDQAWEQSPSFSRRVTKHGP